MKPKASALRNGLTHCRTELATTTEIQKGARTLTGRLLKGLTAISGLVLFAIMLLVSSSVFFRYVLNQPILGDQEFVEVGMSLVVMMAMPYATYSGAHIRVDILDRFLGDLGRFMGDIFARTVGCFILYLMVQKTWDKTVDAAKYNEVTNMIEIPVWVIYGSITVGMSFYILVLVIQLLAQFRHGVANYE